MLAKKDEVLILPLGGLEQIGANSTMIGHDNEWIIVDLGIAFYDKYGIDVLTPDISFSIKMKSHIKGIFITHAHEDHIGAIPYLWEKLRCPIYVTEFPAAVLRQKLESYEWKDEVQIRVVKTNERFNVGKFEMEFIPLAHSILGACGIYIKTPAGNIFHTGDWKIDETPLIGDKIDEEKMMSIGREGVDCLLCDSTNVLSNEDVRSEMDVRNTMIELFERYKDNRITVTCFASNLARIETLLDVAKNAGRKVAVIGRSMHRMIEAVSKTKYFTEKMKSSLGVIIDEVEAMSMPLNQVMFLCTGSQGETRSALNRIARGDNKAIKLGKNDVVLFSSKVIPGNELCIRELQNMLVHKGIEIVTKETENSIHVSGHPNKKALKKMYEWTTPKTCMPIHGDACMLHAHEKFLHENNIKETIIANSGDIISLKNRKLSKVQSIDIEFNAIDGNDIVPVNSNIIKERANMLYSGHISVSFLLTSNNRIHGNPDISLQGIYVKNNEISKKINTHIYQIIKNTLQTQNDDKEKMKEIISNDIKKLMIRFFNKKPVVSLHCHKI